MIRRNWKTILFLVVALVVLGRYLYYTLGITEEQRVLHVIDRAQEAVVDRSLVGLTEVLSQDYHDSSGLDRRSILALAGMHFRTQDHIEIIRMGTEVNFPEEDLATATLRVQILGQVGGQWGRGATDDSLLGEVFTVQLRRADGRWRIIAVNPATGAWPRNNMGL